MKKNSITNSKELMITGTQRKVPSSNLKCIRRNLTRILINPREARIKEIMTMMATKIEGVGKRLRLNI